MSFSSFSLFGHRSKFQLPTGFFSRAPVAPVGLSGPDQDAVAEGKLEVYPRRVDKVAQAHAWLVRLCSYS